MAFLCLTPAHSAVANRANSARAAATAAVKKSAPAKPAPAKPAPSAAAKPSSSSAQKSNSARAASTQKVIATVASAKVRAKVAPVNMNEECYNAYYGCMDMFCMSENENGGSCQCSSTYSQYDATMKEIEKNNDEASRIKTIEVEKVQAGADADILFTGSREYDKDGNVVTAENQKEAKKAARAAELAAMFGTGEEEEEESEFSLEGLMGKDLYDGARGMCLESAQEVCNEKDMTMISQLYLKQVSDDCSALGKVIGDLQRKSEMALLDANRELREARQEAFDKDNEYDRGTCMIEFKKCMMTEDACGADWSRCTNSIAEEAMQNDKTVSTAGTTVSHVAKFDISDSVQEMLSSKRNICERVLDKCLANRQFVWDDFLRDVAPELKIAEKKQESKLRGSCLTTISDCIQKACKDDIVGKGEATMDACLARPDMARSFCKVEIDPCERMEPQIWDYVVSKLAAMRVDVCTNEVNACFAERCGSDFAKCIGMDYEYMHDMCPIDKLVVCKQSRPDFKMADIDDMLMGFFLNVDNSALEVCQNKIDEKMQEVCGSTTDCNKFASDNTIGTGSLQPQKDGATYRISGMLSFGMIKMGNGILCDGETETGKCPKGKIIPIGKIGVADYINEIKKRYPEEKDAGTISSIEAELKNIEGTINRTIDLIESDTTIQFCISGRDLSQINGQGRNEDNKTEGRFPSLLDSQKMLIAASALRQAQNNYNDKFNKEVADAMKDAELDLAQYMCQSIAKQANSGIGGSSGVDQGLVAPYSISYEMSSGLTTAQLTEGGSGSYGHMFNVDSGGWHGSKTSSGQAGSMTTVNAMFNRETRNCHYCKETVTTTCNSSGSQSWFHNNRNIDCNPSPPLTRCEDIAM